MCVCVSFPTCQVVSRLSTKVELPLLLFLLSSPSRPPLLSLLMVPFVKALNVVP